MKSPAKGTDEYVLWEELYAAVEKAQASGVSGQAILGHLGALHLHCEYIILGHIRKLDVVATPDAASGDGGKDAA